MKACKNIFSYFKKDFVPFEYGKTAISKTSAVSTTVIWEEAEGYVGTYSGEGVSKSKAIALAEAELYINYSDEYDIKRNDLIRLDNTEYQVIEIETIYYAGYKTLYMKKKSDKS
jgi:hypothetical protein